MNRSHRFGILTGPLLAWLLATVPAAVASGHHLATRVAEPVAIGGQIYSGGVLELEQIGPAGHLWGLLIDGRRVAIVFREGSAAGAKLLLVRDDVGLLQLRGVRIASVADSLPESVYRNNARRADQVASLPSGSAH